MGTITTKESTDGALAQEVEAKLQAIKNLDATKKDVEKQIGDLKSEIQDVIGEASYEGNAGKIAFVAGTEPSETLDVKRLQDEEPKLYAELLADYPKAVSGRAASYRYTFPK